jgi:hypothetical protein
MLKNKRFIVTAGVLVLSFLLPSIANAQLTQAGVRLGRLGISASTNNDAYVTFSLKTTPTSVAKIILTVPSGFTVTTNASIAVTTANNTTSTPAATTFPGTLTASSTGAGANAGGTITVSTTSTTLAAGTLYDFDIPTGVIANPSTAGQYNFTVASANSSGTPIDTTVVATYIYGTSPNQDQVVVNASVAPSFTFQLSGNTDTIPTASQTATYTSPGVNMTVSTNSPLGYTAYVSSANAKLISATQPTTPIPTGAYDGVPSNATPGTNEYGFVPATVAPGSTAAGSLTYNGEYTISNGTQAGDFNTAGNFAPFEERNGYTSGDIVSLKERVSVGPTIGPATDYTDTLTIVAAGNY